MKNTEKSKCLVPTCENGSGIRGLCNTHYSYCAHAVRHKRTTWAELVAHGKANEPNRTRNRSRWLMDFKKAGK